MQLHCLNQIRSRLWKFGLACINEFQQNLLRNKHAKYSHILCTWIARKFSLIYHDKSHAFGFFFFEKTVIILLLQGYNGKQYFKCMTVFIRGTISHMTLVIFVVKLNISVSRISQIFIFFGRWFNYFGRFSTNTCGLLFCSNDHEMSFCYCASLKLDFYCFHLIGSLLFKWPISFLSNRSLYLKFWNVCAWWKVGSDISNLSYCFILLVSNVELVE